ncbi:MAG: LysM peptidoglycan-binding domain-containing protein [Treponemataceae bacterium]|nr:LysM peptidoglycan-binding domain-containing protein [Treponemataceae bacterium]
MKRFIFIFSLVLIFSVNPLFSKSHKVEKGETLYGISRKYGITVSELCEANKMTTNSVLKYGQTLTIPEKKVEKTSSENKKQTVTKIDTYKVQKGDTLYSISRRFGVSVDTLTILNKMSGTEIQAGQVINVPLAVSEDSQTAKKNEKKPVKNESQLASEKVPQVEELKLMDSRTYDSKKAVPKNLKWPVSVKEIQYVTGKVNGVAISTNPDENVKAICEGNVMFCGIYRGFGNVVFIQNKNGYMYVYSNLDQVSVKEGDFIPKDQRIGNVALDSRSGKNQLLFMVFKNGNPVDPAKAPRG